MDADIGTIKVSVILPVYNVEPYIGRCIESLQVQTLQELEFIFVDDCSTDNSMATVEAWAAQDERVRILRNTENLGAGPTRNRGIEVARGEYLSFVDPDDYVSFDFYELLYTVAKKGGGCDIAKGVRVRIDLRTGIQRSDAEMNTRIMRGMKCGKPLYVLFKTNHQAALYSHALFADSAVRYGTSRNGQDVTFLLKFCSKARTICFNNNAQYFYHYGREGSATAQYSAARSSRDLDTLEQRIDYLLSLERSDYWYDYLVPPFSTYTSRIYLAKKRSKISPEKEKELIDRVVCQLFRIPSYYILMDKIPELDVLVRHRVIIPTTTSESSARDCLECWVSLLERQSTPAPLYKEACSSAVVGCMIDGLRGNRGTVKYVKAQLARLNPAWQKQIMTALPKVFFVKLSQKLKI